ncbi:O-acetyl-ADP-ribose deacetylase [Pseudochryseolinea flava]|uniref:O-acetyl-ADP-ribose deacetylase n=1 Tax=Pseudochryseolinea flava TaxID=2059302 RepID=A0A364Y0H8_9BACT|nr:O-acetyl-ADP-ribose deacetylase [Pseudochryseolinea flava]RAV99412.1 O-acetyl-ADP-ribose deacetylase [Pseudochryseolinea flava]
MKIILQQGDITKLSVDAIVNAANTSLLGGGGVDSAIHRAGGPKILAECMLIRNKQGGCETGEAVITSAGNLKARFVIHTVGPVWNGGHHNEEKLLTSAYHNSLKLATSYAVRTIAFPNISTGIYHFPKEKAARIAIDTVTRFDASAMYIEEVIFCCFDEENYKLYQNLLK